MELKIQKERVLEAAAKCSTAKQALQTLFPEAFDDDSYYKSLHFEGRIRSKDLTVVIENRTDGNYKDKGLYLSTNVKWQILIDNNGVQILVPSKK